MATSSGLTEKDSFPVYSNIELGLFFLPDQNMAANIGLELGAPIGSNWRIWLSKQNTIYETWDENIGYWSLNNFSYISLSTQYLETGDRKYIRVGPAMATSESLLMGVLLESGIKNIDEDKYLVGRLLWLETGHLNGYVTGAMPFMGLPVQIKVWAGCHQPNEIGLGVGFENGWLSSNGKTGFFCSGIYQPIYSLGGIFEMRSSVVFSIKIITR